MKYAIAALVAAAAGCGGGGGGQAACADHAVLDGDTCVCALGYTGDADACTDIDECAAGTAVCDPGDTCQNTDGAYTCVAPPAEYVAIAAGGTTACALRDDHQAWCWGGQAPARTQIAGDWLALAVGQDHTCGLHVDGTLWCWGANGEGQLGTGDTQAHAAPVQIGTATYAEVAAGGAGTCAIAAADRAMWCWGDGVVAPTKIGAKAWVHVARGARYQCAIDDASTLWCWGHDEHDQLGIGDTPTVDAPTQVDTRTDWTAITAGRDVACGIRNATPECWGGVHTATGGPSSSPLGWSTPEVITLTEPLAITAGGSVACANAADGLYCWGDDDFGQLGDGEAGYTHADAPRRIAPAPWTAVAAGDDFACGIDADHLVACWGSNVGGALAFTGGPPARTAPSLVSPDTDWRGVTMIDDTTCGVHGSASDAPVCWGKHPNGDASPTRHQQPAPVGGNLAAQAIGVTGAGACVLADERSLWCWQGAGLVAKVDSGGELWDAVSAGTGVHACGVRGGKLYCWGPNAHAELGTGSADATIHPPTQVFAGVTDWQSVVTYAQPAPHTCGVRATHAMTCWGGGYGAAGQDVAGAWDRAVPSSVADTGLQSGVAYTFAPGTAPAAVSPIAWRDFAVDAAIKPDGTLWSLAGPAPTQIGTDADWQTVAGTGDGEHCATKTTGTLWCWGAGRYGDLGFDGAWSSLPYFLSSD